MKKQKLLGIFLISTMLLCGCTKMEKDTSYDTDLYGTYKEEINATNTDYERKVTYTLNEDNTYDYEYDNFMRVYNAEGTYIYNEETGIITFSDNVFITKGIVKDEGILISERSEGDILFNYIPKQ